MEIILENITLLLLLICLKYLHIKIKKQNKRIEVMQEELDNLITEFKDYIESELRYLKGENNDKGRN